MTDTLLIAFTAMDASAIALAIADQFTADPNGDNACAQLVRTMVVDYMFDDHNDFDFVLSDTGVALYRQTFLTFDGQDVKAYLLDGYDVNMGNADLAAQVMMLCI